MGVKKFNPTVTIPANDAIALSAGVDVSTRTPVAMVLPSGWTAATITFQASFNGATFSNMYESDGTELSSTVAASQHVVLDPVNFAGVKWLKLRSGTLATPVEQTDDRAIEVITRDV